MLEDKFSCLSVEIHRSGFRRIYTKSALTCVLWIRPAVLPRWQQGPPLQRPLQRTFLVLKAVRLQLLSIPPWPLPRIGKIYFLSRENNKTIWEKTTQALFCTGPRNKPLTASYLYCFGVSINGLILRNCHIEGHPLQSATWNNLWNKSSAPYTMRSRNKTWKNAKSWWNSTAELCILGKRIPAVT